MEAKPMHGEYMDQESKMRAEKLNTTLAKLYDHSSRIWEDTSGDHFHHGFYDTSPISPNSDVRSAQIRMIEEALRFASVLEDPLKKPKKILDVGCGIGGSSRYLATKYGAQCKGIDLSPAKVGRARVLTAAQGLESQVSFEVADAMNQPFPDGEFDLVWCIDCADHLPDKTKFVHELARVAAPGATIIIITWCHRDLSPSEHDLRPDEKKLLNMDEMPVIWCSTAHYINLLESLSLQDIKFADWTQHVAPFWPAIRKLRSSWKGIIAVIRHCGLKIKMSIEAMRKLSITERSDDLLKYSIITCKAPE